VRHVETLLWVLGVNAVVFGPMTLLLWWQLRQARLEAYEGIVLDKQIASHVSLDFAETQYFLVMDTGAGKPLTRRVDADTYIRARPGDRVVKRPDADPALHPGPPDGATGGR
jgi:hypothetical protein